MKSHSCIVLHLALHRLTRARESDIVRKAFYKVALSLAETHVSLDFSQKWLAPPSLPLSLAVLVDRPSVCATRCVLLCERACEGPKRTRGRARARRAGAGARFCSPFHSRAPSLRSLACRLVGVDAVSRSPAVLREGRGGEGRGGSACRCCRRRCRRRAPPLKSERSDNGANTTCRRASSQMVTAAAAAGLH